MSIKLKGSSDGSVSLDAPSDTSPSGTDVSFTLPTADGSNGQVIQTNGSGALSFTSLPSGSVVGSSFFRVYDNSGDTGTSSYVALGNTTGTVNIFENVGSDYDGTTNKGRYTAPAAGLYRFFVVGQLNSVTSGLTINIQFYKNGAAQGATGQDGGATRSYNNNGDPAIKHGVQCVNEYVVTLAANDYVEARIKYTGSSNSSAAAAFDRRGMFIGYRLN
tara:strand:- start:84 stop:737 length:654 start_codon:yes stop_codon:yes gene_type:complete